MLMIHPLSPHGCGSCSIICLPAYLHPKKLDRALTRMVRSKMSSSVSWVGLALVGVQSGAMPALLTMLS